MLTAQQKVLKCVTKSGEPFMGLVKLRAIIKPYYFSTCMAIQQLPLALDTFAKPPPPLILFPDMSEGTYS